MKTLLPCPRRGRGRRPLRGERGFASVIVLALLFVMIALILGNGRVVHSLAQELRLVEQRQLQKYGGLAITNAVARVQRLSGTPIASSGTPPETADAR